VAQPARPPGKGQAAVSGGQPSAWGGPAATGAAPGLSFAAAAGASKPKNVSPDYSKPPGSLARGPQLASAAHADAHRVAMSGPGPGMHPSEPLPLGPDSGTAVHVIDDARPLSATPLAAYQQQPGGSGKFTALIPPPPPYPTDSVQDPAPRMCRLSRHQRTAPRLRPW